MRVRIWSRKRMNRWLCAAAILLLGAAFLYWPQAVATGVSRGLSLCGGVVIPSLFVFLVLTGVAVRTGLAAAAGRRLARPVGRLYGLPGASAAALFVSLVGGYPAGAAAVRELLDRDELTVPQARRLLRGCVNAGPAFIIGGVGAGLLGSAVQGAVLFAAHVLSAVVTGLLCCRGGREADNAPARLPRAAASAAEALVGSVNAACRSMLHLCGFVVLSAALLSVADAAGITAGLRALFAPLSARLGWPEAAASGLLSGLLEVSCGCAEAAACRAAAPLLLGMILGFGGLSVHGQVAAAVAGYPLIDRRFFEARIIQALLGGAFSVLLFRMVPLPQPTLAAADGSTVQWFTTSVTATAALLSLCGIWLLCLPAARERQ